MTSEADLREQLRLVFATEDAIDESLDTPDPSLGGHTPRETASQPGGLEPTRALISRMIHGFHDSSVYNLGRSR